MVGQFTKKLNAMMVIHFHLNFVSFWYATTTVLWFETLWCPQEIMHPEDEWKRLTDRQMNKLQAITFIYKYNCTQTGWHQMEMEIQESSSVSCGVGYDLNTQWWNITNKSHCMFVIMRMTDVNLVFKHLNSCCLFSETAVTVSDIHCHWFSDLWHTSHTLQWYLYTTMLRREVFMNLSRWCKNYGYL